MRTPVEVQLWRVAVLFFSGILYNILFRAYTALRAVASPGKITRHLLDALVAGFLLLVLGCIIFVVNYGEMRLYIPVSLSAGFIMTNALVGDLAYSIFLSCFKTMRRFLRKVRKTVLIAAKSIRQKFLVPLKNQLFPPTPPGNGSNNGSQL